MSSIHSRTERRGVRAPSAVASQLSWSERRPLKADVPGSSPGEAASVGERPRRPGYGLQNRTGGFDSRSRFHALVDQLEGQPSSKRPHAGSSPAGRAIRIGELAERQGNAVLTRRVLRDAQVRSLYSPPSRESGMIPSRSIGCCKKESAGWPMERRLLLPLRLIQSCGRGVVGCVPVFQTGGAGSIPAARASLPSPGAKRYGAFNAGRRGLNSRWQDQLLFAGPRQGRDRLS